MNLYLCEITLVTNDYNKKKVKCIYLMFCSLFSYVVKSTWSKWAIYNGGNNNTKNANRSGQFYEFAQWNVHDWRESKIWVNFIKQPRLISFDKSEKSVNKLKGNFLT